MKNNTNRGLKLPYKQDAVPFFRKVARRLRHWNPVLGTLCDQSDFFFSFDLAGAPYRDWL